MRKTILVLIGILAVVSNCLADSIKLQFNVNGADCKHLHITDVNGRLIASTTEAVIMSPIEDSDTELIKTLKKYIKCRSPLGHFLHTRTTLKGNSLSLG